MLDLTMVGAGDVLRRYVAAIAALDERYSLRIADIVDVRPAAETREAAAQAGCPSDVRVHEMRGTAVEDLDATLAAIPDQPAVIATPMRYHVAYATRVLDRGLFAIVEKPYAHRRDDLERFDRAVARHGTDRLFLMGYYALEKGLPLLVLARGGDVDPVYLAGLTPEVPKARWAEVRASLGRVRSVSGCILEGRGTAAVLEARDWILDLEAGGTTVELFYHLVCLGWHFWEGCDIQLEQVVLLRDSLAARWYEGRSGRPAGETFTAVRLRIGEHGSATLVAGKYVPESLHQRWLRVEFEGGTAAADFEARTLAVDSDAGRLDAALAPCPAYTSQLRILAEKLRRASVPTELALFRGALLLTIGIREAGLAAGILGRDTRRLSEDAVRAYLDGEVSRAF
jgi:hypothetical protein